ncbi:MULTISPECIES: hypothetical protein [Pseudomonadota]|jgi:predicted membrane-bound dolichyl-phosphate-mannose-protein mannosyltransferase|uniref:hypothetical protein n=1 Tax=Pseudomonadota TaxID=1224 RepID=UPI001A6407AF|nr:MULTISPECIES: hypothetical protein [Pseudomonadota]MBL4722221.1 hypothetical protein [Alcanivorax sp.]MDY7099438.1 hypothetical protein [Pseudomonadota bacterium]QXF14301.1 hypothetical protein HBA51_18650 [Sphingopyxis terrae subsp. terrae]|tara:strand:- start:9 stop:182 length:174 start_codon:yes stop_codon:yes gene_type:complete
MTTPLAAEIIVTQPMLRATAILAMIDAAQGQAEALGLAINMVHRAFPGKAALIFRKK